MEIKANGSNVSDNNIDVSESDISSGDKVIQITAVEAGTSTAVSNLVVTKVTGDAGITSSGKTITVASGTAVGKEATFKASASDHKDVTFTVKVIS